MTDINNQLLDYSIHHAVNLGRYSGKVVRDILALLNDADKDILAKILARGEDGTFTAARLKKLLAELREMTGEAYRQAHNELKTAMLDFGAAEAEATVSLLAAQVPVTFNIVQPTAEQLAAIVSKAPVTVGPDKKLLLEEIFTSLAKNKEEAIRGAIRLGMVEGETVPEMVRRLQGSRASRYTDGIFEKDRRNAEAIVRTVCNHTSNQAVQLTFEKNSAVVSKWRFLATMDSRVTIICASLNGTEHPIGQGPIPPRHVRCLPGDALVSSSSGITAVSKRWYDGNMIIIKTASSRILSCTPNHPILTPGGWVAAGLLNVGGHVISDGGSKWGSNIDSNDKDMPTRIEDVAKAFLSSGKMMSMPVPLSPEDFHGDGVGSKIAIISADRELWVSGDSPFGKHIPKLNFVSRNYLASCLRPLEKFGPRTLNPSDRIMSGLGKFFTFIGRGAGHACKLLLATVAGLDSVIAKQFNQISGRTPYLLGNTGNPYSFVKKVYGGFKRNYRPVIVGLYPGGLESSMNRTASRSVFDRNLCRSHPGFIFLDNNINRWNIGTFPQFRANAFKNFVNADSRTVKFVANIFRVLTGSIKAFNFFGMRYKRPYLSLFSLTSDPNAALSQNIGDAAMSDAILGSYIASGKAGRVFVDNIIDVKVSEFHGHVYNLQTESNWYAAEGIITHNCRSFQVPVLKSWKDLGIDMEEMPASYRASKDGPVAADITFDKWLKGQDVATQKDILGATRQKLFASGELRIDRFTDRAGVVYDLPELKKRNEAAFKKVFG